MPASKITGWYTNHDAAMNSWHRVFVSKAVSNQQSAISNQESGRLKQRPLIADY